MKTQPFIDPIYWLSITNERHATQSYTPWFDGTTHPARVGWYDRCFTDGTYRHWWDGVHWYSNQLIMTEPHWRQVGDYPSWRGLATPFLVAKGGTEPPT